MPALWIRLGECYEQLQQTDRAIEVYEAGSWLPLLKHASIVPLPMAFPVARCLRDTGMAAMQAAPDDLRLSSTLAHLYRQAGLAAKAEALERQGTRRSNAGPVLPSA